MEVYQERFNSDNNNIILEAEFPNEPLVKALKEVKKYFKGRIKENKAPEQIEGNYRVEQKYTYDDALYDGFIGEDDDDLSAEEYEALYYSEEDDLFGEPPEIHLVSNDEDAQVYLQKINGKWSVFDMARIPLNSWNSLIEAIVDEEILPEKEAEKLKL